MRLVRTWIGVDIIATRVRGDIGRGKIVVHSAMGRRQNRVLGRWASKINENAGQLLVDLEGEQLLAGVLKDRLEPVFARLDEPGFDPSNLVLVDESERKGDIEWRSHWVTAPDGFPVAYVVWLAPGPIEPRPVYNSWVLDLDEVTTRSAGDDLSIIGSDRKVGEARPIYDLLQWANAADAPNFLGLYWDACTAPKGTISDAQWSIRPPDAAEWVHFLSTAHAGIGPTDRSVYGLSVRLPARPGGLDLSLRQLSVFSNSSLILVDADRQFVLHSSGAVRDELGDQRIAELVGEAHLAECIAGWDQAGGLEATVTVNGRDYDVMTLPLPSVQSKPVRPAAILVRSVRDRAAVS